MLTDYVGIGGAQEIAVRAATASAGEPLHVEVGFLHGAPATHHVHLLRDSHVPIISFGSPNRWLTRLNMVLPFRFLRYLRRQQVDLIHLHCVSTPMFLVVLAKLLLRVRLMITLHCRYDHYLARNRKYLKALLRFFDRVVFVLYGSPEETGRKLAVPTAKRTFIYARGQLLVPRLWTKSCGF